MFTDYFVSAFAKKKKKKKAVVHKTPGCTRNTKHVVLFSLSCNYSCFFEVITTFFSSITCVVFSNNFFSSTLKRLNYQHFPVQVNSTTFSAKYLTKISAYLS